MATTLLSGCGIYSHYEKPDMSYLDSLQQIIVADSLQLDTLSIKNLSWRNIFTDATLQSLIEEGLANNTDLGVARLRTEEAKATLQASKMSFFPSASLSVEGTISGNDGNTTKSLLVGPSFGWELDIFGKNRNTKEAAKAALAYAEANSQSVQTNLIATIAESYFTLLMLDEQLDISRRTLKTWEENIRTLSALKQAGKTNEASVLQAKANRLKVEGSVLTMEKQIVLQENSLFSLLGTMPRQLSRGKLSEQQFPNSLAVSVPIRVLSNRPDVRQAEYSLMEAFYLTNEARAMFYPSLSLSGMLGWKKSSGGGIDNPGAWLFNAIGELMQPLFNRGANISRLKIAKARQEEALLVFKQTLLDAGVEANNALISWQTARKRLSIDKKQILNLQAAVWNTQLLMKHGAANYLEVLTSQQNLLQAELTESDDRFDEIQSVIHFYKALGGGVE